MTARRAGFTLIEVLVVAAIMTLLIGIIVPSLAGSKKFVRRVACRHHLRAVTLGLMTYAECHDASLPPSVQRFGKRERPDLSANILFHRESGFDMTVLLHSHVSPGALNCPEVRGQEYKPAGPDRATVYSNYLFLWRTLDRTPEEGYARLNRAPRWAAAVVDLSWTVYQAGGPLYGGNHIESRAHGYGKTPFVSADRDDWVGSQYLASTRRAICGMNAGFYDGSVEWVANRRRAWRDAGPFDQAAFRNSRVYLPVSPRTR